jgi:hypothetical protein
MTGGVNYPLDELSWQPQAEATSLASPGLAVRDAAIEKNDAEMATRIASDASTRSQPPSRLGKHGRIVRHELVLGEIKIGPKHAGGWAAPDPDHGLCRRRFDRAAAQILPGGVQRPPPLSARQVVLLVIDRAPRSCLRLADAAVLRVHGGLPCRESSYELRMADHLVAAGRRFVQPLRDDQTDEVVPDFVLGEPNVAVEVWGVKGRELYDLRRKAKLGIYEVRRPTLTLLQWDVTDPLPDVELHRPPPQ